jgi:hypothetical protein
VAARRLEPPPGRIVAAQEIQHLSHGAGIRGRLAGPHLAAPRQEHTGPPEQGSIGGLHLHWEPGGVDPAPRGDNLRALAGDLDVALVVGEGVGRYGGVLVGQ